ncbi:hypothetical protein D3875_01035 [Deinococcus cavernae]|uniref:Uncharacterized protein n=1 Tax=Deinococcus cavernae TaxID=2320857 RepID=A0A418VHM6_9DEIO|nr:hypothetical protein D3875_01035 [Deinococcus cavernae]
MDKGRVIFHELLTDFAFPVISLDKGEKVLEFLEDRRFSEARLELEAGRPYQGQQQDQAALVMAIITAGQGQFQEALDLAACTLPFVSLDRPLCALVHWIGAVAQDGLGRTEDALYWCSLAADQASSPSARPLQVGILCCWVKLLAKTGQSGQAAARMHQALRQARLPHELFHAHLTAARLWWHSDLKKAQFHLVLAQNLAKTPERLVLVADVPNTPRPNLLTGKQGRVTITLLAGLEVEVAGVRVSAARSPRAALLLAYLVQNGGEAISEIAEQILPMDTAIKSLDKAKSDRAARVRQHLTQARRLLGDPAGVMCKGSRLWLGQQYDWESDLRLAVLSGTFDGGQVLPVLACPWLEELSFTLNSPS